jgi:hypothetical protein
MESRYNKGGRRWGCHLLVLDGCLGARDRALLGALSSETKGVMGQIIEIDNKPSPERSVYFGT